MITHTLSASGSSESPKKVIVGMSGGVDSSVSAYLLQQAGHEVSGLFMKNWEEDDGTEYCTAQADLADAQSVCNSLGIELLTANFAAEYWENVFEHFLAEYRSGRTPNPDVLCNREIKFKAFLDYAHSLGADCIATGHYVQRVDEGSRSYLHKGVDVNKDQTYFLCEITEENVRDTLFPIGNLKKSYQTYIFAVILFIFCSFYHFHIKRLVNKAFLIIKFLIFIYILEIGDSINESSNLLC